MGAERVARQRNENVTSHRPPVVGAPPWVSRSQRARERAGRRGAPPVRVSSVGVVVVGAPACCCAHSNRRAPRPPAGPVRQRTHGSVARRKPPLPSAQRGRASKSKRRSKRVAGRGPRPPRRAWCRADTAAPHVHDADSFPRGFKFKAVTVSFARARARL